MYFEIHVNPSYEVSSDVVLVDNFHPRWREAAGKLMSGRLIQLVNTYAKSISCWSRVPLTLEFSQEYGLTHIHLPDRKGLDLWSEQQKYRSHKIHTPTDVAVTVAVVSDYIGWINFALRDIEK